MRYDERHYTDGTEPDVVKRFCCDGRCEQGRHCPALHPAEAATEVGQDEDVTRLFRVGDLLAGIVIVAVLAFLTGWITK